MAALKDDDDDLWWCNQPCLANIDSLTVDKSLSDLNSKPLKCGNPPHCSNNSFIENNDIYLMWLGYRSREENKTLIIGVPAI
jgi:hypothetical protein